MLPIKEYIAHPRITTLVLIEHLGQWLPDSVYLKLMYLIKMNRKLDLHNPKSFTEKLQWLKLYDRRPEYTMMVDKYAVKDYVSSIIGVKHVIPTLGVWNNPEEIDFDSLPKQFVLKTTHGGGSSGVVICRDKDTFDRITAVEKLRSRMSQNIYKFSKEWPYKNVPRRVIAEQYIEPRLNNIDLADYKWYCFNGEPKFCQVIQNRTTNESIDFFDVNWIRQEFIGLIPASQPYLHASEVEIPRPENLETQIRIARKLSRNIPFSRIDLYDVGDRVLFGEITFFPASGFGVLRPEQYNEILGNMIELPSKDN